MWLDAMNSTKRQAAATSAAERSGADADAATSAYSARYWASFAVGLACLVAAVVISFLGFGKSTATFTPDTSKFDLFAGFYVAAQSIERFTEFFSGVCPPLGDDDATKADRAWVIGGITLVLGVLTAKSTGLMFLTAIGWTSPSHQLDILATGLILAGGSKSLHDLISAIQTRS